MNKQKPVPGDQMTGTLTLEAQVNGSKPVLSTHMIKIWPQLTLDAQVDEPKPVPPGSHSRTKWPSSLYLLSHT